VTEQLIAITRSVSWALMPHKCISGRGCAPDPAGGAYSLQRSRRPLAGCEGAALPAYAYKSAGLL